MSLEIMQMKMNNIADKIENLSLRYYTLWNNQQDLASNYDERRLLYSQHELLESLSSVIKEEMQITNY